MLPGIRRLRLWRDALDHFGISTQELPCALSGKEKFLLDHGKPSVNEPLRLAAVVVLVPQSSDTVAIERLRGALAVAEIHAVVHMLQAARALGRGPQIFAAAARLITAGVTVWQLRFPNDLACLDEAAMKALGVIA